MLPHFAGEEVHKIFKTLDGTGEDIKDYKLAKDSPRSTSNHKRTWSTNATFFVQRNRILAKHLTSKTQTMKSCRYMRVYWVQRPRSSPANHSSRFILKAPQTNFAWNGSNTEEFAWLRKSNGNLRDSSLRDWTNQSDTAPHFKAAQDDESVYGVRQLHHNINHTTTQKPEAMPAQSSRQ